MLTRRHIRVKVLQSIYAYNQSEDKNLEKQEEFLLYNMEQMHCPIWTKTNKKMENFCMSKSPAAENEI